MARSRRYEAGVGLLVLGALGLLAWMALQVGAISGPGEQVVVDVELPDAAGLSEGAVVSVAGVQVGRVQTLSVDFDRARARVALDVDAQIRRDARWGVRARSLLGEKYLEIAPVSRDAPPLQDGDAVVVAESQVEIDELVARMSPLLSAVDPEIVRDAATALAEAVRADPERPARMLADAERLLKNAADASEDLPELVAEGRATLADVRRVTADARPLLAKLEGSAERLDQILAAVPPEQVPAVLAELQAAVKEGRAVVQKLDGSTGDLAELLAKANAIDGEDIRRIAREEGVLIRFKPKKVP